jgi:hypothetical protein
VKLNTEKVEQNVSDFCSSDSKCIGGAALSVGATAQTRQHKQNNTMFCFQYLSVPHVEFTSEKKMNVPSCFVEPVELRVSDKKERWMTTAPKQNSILDIFLREKVSLDVVATNPFCL